MEWDKCVMAVIEADTKSSVIIIYIGLIGVQIRFEEWSLWFCQNEYERSTPTTSIASAHSQACLPRAHTHTNSFMNTTILIYRRFKRRERKINESNPYRIHCFGFRS